MGLFPLIVAAALLPAVFTAAGYFISFRRIPDDHEIRARKRWKLANRGNAVFLISVFGGVIGVAEACRDLPAVAKILISCLFILITFTPFMIVLGAIDRRLREIEFPLGGYIKFQYFLFFGRWSSVLVIVAFLLLPVGLTAPHGGVSFTGVGVMIGGAALFILCSLYQMRVVGRLTGALVPAGSDDGPAGDIARLSEKAGVTGTKVLFMETFGYPFYNAFAAPGKIIYITRPLLGALSREELSAIAAHEIGHLTTMKRRTAFSLAILTVCIVALWFLVDRIPRLLSDINSFLVEIVVILFFFLAAVLSLGAASRRFEARADTAGAELTGGPEPMIAALEKIYRLGMLPRRFDKKGSENASHPSLERRVAQLRGEKLPKPKRNIKRTVILWLGVVILMVLFFLFRSGSRRGVYVGGEFQYVWVNVAAALEERLALDPDDFEAAKRLAIAYWLTEEDDAAAAAVERALSLRQDPGLLMVRGFIRDFYGDRAGALAAMEEAWKAGGATSAAKWAAVLAASLGDPATAGRYTGYVARDVPHDPFIHQMEAYYAGLSKDLTFSLYAIAFQGRPEVPPAGVTPKQ
jgi:Zn-dependent protease with chaperone function